MTYRYPVIYFFLLKIDVLRFFISYSFFKMSRIYDIPEVFSTDSK